MKLASTEGGSRFTIGTVTQVLSSSDGGTEPSKSAGLFYYFHSHRLSVVEKLAKYMNARPHKTVPGGRICPRI